MQSNITEAEVFEGEVVEKKAQELEPIIVQASIQFVINPTDNVLTKVDMLMSSAINKHQHKKVIPTQRYANTAHAAAYIDVDESFLTKRKGKAFKLGIHFFKPAGESIVRWDTKALAEWMTADYTDNLIDDELAALLERS